MNRCSVAPPSAGENSVRPEEEGEAPTAEAAVDDGDELRRGGIEVDESGCGTANRGEGRAGKGGSNGQEVWSTDHLESSGNLL
jgi:hypothetical protein